MSGYPPGSSLPPRARQPGVPPPGSYGAPGGMVPGGPLRPMPRRPAPFDGLDAPGGGGGVPGLGPSSFGQFHDPPRGGIPAFMNRYDEQDEYDMLSRQQQQQRLGNALMVQQQQPQQQGPPPSQQPQRRGPQDWGHPHDNTSMPVFVHHHPHHQPSPHHQGPPPSQQHQQPPPQQSSLWGPSSSERGGTSSLGPSWPGSLVDGPPRGSFVGGGMDPHTTSSLGIHYLTNNRLPPGAKGQDDESSAASTSGNLSANSGTSSQRSVSFPLAHAPVITTRPGKHSHSPPGRDIENGDGTITREEFVEVYVLRPPSPIPRHVPPTIKDVTIMAPRPEQRSHILRAYPKERLAYTFPDTALHDQKRLRSTRDSAVVRLKKNVLNRYVSYDAWRDRQPGPGHPWYPGGGPMSSKPPEEPPQHIMPPRHLVPSHSAPPSSLGGPAHLDDHLPARGMVGGSGYDHPPPHHLPAAFPQPVHHLPLHNPLHTHHRGPPPLSGPPMLPHELEPPPPPAPQQPPSVSLPPPPVERERPPQPSLLAPSSVPPPGGSGGGGGGGGGGREGHMISQADKIAAAAAAADAELLVAVQQQQQLLSRKKPQQPPPPPPQQQQQREQQQQQAHQPPKQPPPQLQPAPTTTASALPPKSVVSGNGGSTNHAPPSGTTTSAKPPPPTKSNKKKSPVAPPPAAPSTTALPVIGPAMKLLKRPPPDDDDAGSMAPSVEEQQAEEEEEEKPEVLPAQKQPQPSTLAVPEGKPEDRVVLLRDALLNGESVDLDNASLSLLHGVDMDPLTLRSVTKRMSFLSKHYKEASRMFNMDGKLMPAPLSARRRAKEEAELEAEGFENPNGDDDDDDDEGSSGGLALAAPSKKAPGFVAALPVGEEKWVQCDKCSKWRRLPPDVDVNKLPTRWYCSMNKRRPDVATCDAPEEPYADPTAADPREMQDKRRIRAMHRRFEDDDKYTRSHQHQGAGDQVRRPIGVTDWIQCSNPLCGKWRALSKPYDGNLFVEKIRKGMGSRTEQLWYCWMNTWDRDKASCASPQEGTLVPLRYSSRNRRMQPRPPLGYSTKRGYPVGGKRPLASSHHHAGGPPTKRRLPPPHNGRSAMDHRMGGGDGKGQSPVLGTGGRHPSSSMSRAARGGGGGGGGGGKPPYGSSSRAAFSPPPPSGPPPRGLYGGRQQHHRHHDDDDDGDEDDDEDGMEDD